MSEQKAKGRLARLGLFLKNYWFELLLAVVPALATLAFAVYSDEIVGWITSDPATAKRIRSWGIISSIVLWAGDAALAVVNIFRQKIRSELEAKLKAAEEEGAAWLQDVFELSDGYIYTLATNEPLKFSNTDRITIYCHDETTQKFVQLGRFSYNPDWDSRGRKEYPRNQGCLGRAWQRGEYFINDLPDPSYRYDSYIERCNQEGVPREVLVNLRMRSRLYYGKVVRDLSGRRPLAVVIIESTDPNRFTLEQLQHICSGERSHYLSELVSRLAPRMPKPSVAREAGF